MGCFWGAEKRMSALPGVVSTEVGYAGGDFPSPNYAEVQAAEHQGIKPNYAEVVKVTFDPARTSLGANPDRLLGKSRSDPGQSARQRYRFQLPQRHLLQRRPATGAGATDPGRLPAGLDQGRLRQDQHRDRAAKGLLSGRGISSALPEEDTPSGYCGLGGTGVPFPGHESAKQAGCPAPRFGQPGLAATGRVRGWSTVRSANSSNRR